MVYHPSFNGKNRLLMSG